MREVQGNHTIDRTYNKEGDCTHITSSLGADIRQTYDAEGNLVRLESGDAWQADWRRDQSGLELHREMTGGVSVGTERDRFGREVRKTVGARNVEQSRKQYTWGIGNRLLSIRNELRSADVRFEYDAFDNLIKADYEDRSKIESVYRVPDAIGNLYETPNRSDRKYGKGGRLLEDPQFFYHYDVEGNLCFKEFKKQHGYSSIGKEAIEKKYKIKFRGSATGWLYEWTAGGMLQRVVNPERGKVCFGYDPLGRRVYKETKQKRTNWLWDGNVPLHEWDTLSTEGLVRLITWVFAEGFVPCAKITADNSYSIVTDYLGTPTQMFNKEGENVWDAELDIYGKVRTFKGSSLSDCPFRYQGQYLDEETGLYYNRFRYYDPSVGNYISQDPIGLAGGKSTLYSYVSNSNFYVERSGLEEIVGALFEIDGQVFQGTNPTNRTPRVHEEIPELKDLGYVNADKFSMHAEIDSMSQAKKAGLSGGKATLMVDGLPVCGNCRPAVLTYAKSMGITELEVHELSTGKVYRFVGDEINMVKDGGKSWKNAEVHH